MSTSHGNCVGSGHLTSAAPFLPSAQRQRSDRVWLNAPSREGSVIASALPFGDPRIVLKGPIGVSVTFYCIAFIFFCAFRGTPASASHFSAGKSSEQCLKFLQLMGRPEGEKDDPVAEKPGFDNFLLVVTEEHHLVFAIAPYLSLDTHSFAAKTVELATDSKIKFYLGGGELERAERTVARGDERQDAVQFVAGNETSGFVSRQPKQKRLNSISLVEKILRKLLPDMVADDFETFPYSKTCPRVHLDPRLNDSVRGTGEHLRNVRHDAANDLSVLLPNIDMLVGVVPREGSHAEQMRLMIGRNTLGLEAFLKLFATDSYTPPRVAVLQRWLARVRRLEALEVREYKALHTYLEAMNAGIREPTVRLVHLGVWNEAEGCYER